MNKIAKFAAICAVGAAAVAPAAAADAPVCLQNRFIDHTTVLDSKTILFRMKDGKVWRNTMSSACPELRFNGFVSVTHDDQICGGLQSIRVLNSGEVCMLGRFTPETPAHS